MKTECYADPVAAPAVTETTDPLELPLGLLGFEHARRFGLLARSAETPFRWLQMLEEPRLAFLVMPPGAVMPDYAPELSGDDVAFLGLSNASDAMLLNIVTLRSDGRATVNLKGPIVVNRTTGRAKQVIPLNVTRYPVQYPLVVAASEPCTQAA